MGLSLIKETSASAPDYSALIRSYLGGSGSAGEELALHVRSILHRRLRRLAVSGSAVEEIAQDCMLQVFGRLGEFSVEKGLFESWVGGFAVNALRSARRREMRARVSPYPLDDSSTPTYDITSIEHDRDVLTTALDSLEVLDRELLHMRYSLGMSSDEIATSSNLNAPQVRKRLSRAVERLRRHPAMATIVQG